VLIGLEVDGGIRVPCWCISIAWLINPDKSHDPSVAVSISKSVLSSSREDLDKGEQGIIVDATLGTIAS
jgi:hypothetical protein